MANRIDSFFELYDCPPAEAITIPQGHYAGPLIDTHLHMPVLPDSPAGFAPSDVEVDGFEDFIRDRLGDRFTNDMETDLDALERQSGLSDREIARNRQMPHAGQNITMGELACTLRNEGTVAAMAYYGVFRGNEGPMLEMARRATEEYGDVFAPFLMPPDDGDSVPGRPPTMDAEHVTQFLDAYPGLFRGFGELGLYRIDGRSERDFPPDSSLLMDIYPLASEHNLLVYLHPGDGHAPNLARALAEFPEITFIVHGPETKPFIVDLMDRYSNVYYTFNNLYGGEYLLRPEESVESFLAKTSDFPPLLAYDLGEWKGPIERHPDRFMWGTDRGGDSVWYYDPLVSRRLVDYARAFIGGLDPSAQEGYAYKNAERLIADSGL